MSESASALVARRLITALVAHGVREVVYCPGSRDAPFAYVVDSCEKAGWLRVFVRLDERSAGFMALGIAKAAKAQGSTRPVAVITTSGTAVANLHPAVCEADAAGIPLIVCTADRPHEMWGTGANQTTHQLGIFGQMPRYQADIPADFPPDERLDGLTARAVAASTGRFTDNPGPIHLNVCLRDPLVPEQSWSPGDMPSQQVFCEESTGQQSHQSGLARSITMPGSSIVIAGDGAGAQAEEIARTGGWPLCAEPSSGARFGPNALVDYQGLLTALSSGDAGSSDGGHDDAQELAGQLEGVIVIGHPTLSRPVSRLLSRRDVHILVVANGAQWTDVAGLGQVVSLSARIEGSAPAQWLDGWKQADAHYRHQRPVTPKDQACAIIWQAHHDQAGVGEADSPNTSLMIGASGIIRSFDRNAEPHDAPGLVLSNRGLAGIDGTISTSLGIAAATGRPVRVVVGDLTALHDMTGLLAGELEPELDIQVIIVADHGGAIFSGLEHRDVAPADAFARYFTTPQRADFKGLAAATGASYRTALNPHELAEILTEPIAGRSIIEVPLDQWSSN